MAGAGNPYFDSDYSIPAADYGQEVGGEIAGSDIGGTGYLPTEADYEAANAGDNAGQMMPGGVGIFQSTAPQDPNVSSGYSITGGQLRTASDVVGEGHPFGPLQSVMDAMSVPFNYGIVRPTATWLIATNPLQNTSTRGWDRVQASWNQSEYVDPGQAWQASPTGAGNMFTEYTNAEKQGKLDFANRDQTLDFYKHDSVLGSIMSGVANVGYQAAVGWYADPIVLLGYVGKASKVAAIGKIVADSAAVERESSLVRNAVENGGDLNQSPLYRAMSEVYANSSGTQAARAVGRDRILDSNTPDVILGGVRNTVNPHAPIGSAMDVGIKVSPTMTSSLATDELKGTLKTTTGIDGTLLPSGWMVDAKNVDSATGDLLNQGERLVGYRLTHKGQLAQTELNAAGFPETAGVRPSADQALPDIKLQPPASDEALVQPVASWNHGTLGAAVHEIPGAQGPKTLHATLREEGNTHVYTNNHIDAAAWLNSDIFRQMPNYVDKGDVATFLASGGDDPLDKTLRVLTALGDQWAMKQVLKTDPMGVLSHDAIQAASRRIDELVAGSGPGNGMSLLDRHLLSPDPEQLKVTRAALAQLDDEVSGFRRMVETVGADGGVMNPRVYPTGRFADASNAILNKTGLPKKLTGGVAGEAGEGGRMSRQLLTNPNVHWFQAASAAGRWVGIVNRGTDEMPNGMVNIGGIESKVDNVKAVESIVRDAPFVALPVRSTTNRIAGRGGDAIVWHDGQVMTGNERGRWIMDEFMRLKATQGVSESVATQDAVKWFEQEMVQSTLTANGIKGAVAADIIKDFKNTIQPLRWQKQKEMAETGYGTTIGADGEFEVLHDPVMAGHLENHYQVIDMRELQRTFETPSAAAAYAHAAVKGGAKVGDAIMNVWKPLVLARPLSYPIRNVFIEATSRLIATLGAGYFRMLTHREGSAAGNAMKAEQAAEDLRLGFISAISEDKQRALEVLRDSEHVAAETKRLAAEQLAADQEVRDLITRIQAGGSWSIEHVVDMNGEVKNMLGEKFLPAFDNGATDAVPIRAFERFDPLVTPDRVTAHANDMTAGKMSDLPVVLGVHPETGEVHVIDGVNRIEAAKTAGISHMPVRVVVDRTGQGVKLRTTRNDLSHLATPEPAEGMVRLYRSEPIEGKGVPQWAKDSPQYANTQKATGRWFTDDLEEARWYVANENPGGKITYVDVPADRVGKYRVSDMAVKDGGKSVAENPAAFSRRPEKEFFLPRKVADSKQEFKHAPSVSARPGAPELVPARDGSHLVPGENPPLRSLVATDGSGYLVQRKNSEWAWIQSRAVRDGDPLAKQVVDSDGKHYVLEEKGRFASPEHFQAAREQELVDAWSRGIGKEGTTVPVADVFPGAQWAKASSAERHVADVEKFLSKAEATRQGLNYNDVVDAKRYLNLAMARQAQTHANMADHLTRAQVLSDTGHVGISPEWTAALGQLPDRVQAAMHDVAQMHVAIAQHRAMISNADELAAHLHAQEGVRPHVTAGSERQRPVLGRKGQLRSGEGMTTTYVNGVPYTYGGIFSGSFGNIARGAVSADETQKAFLASGTAAMKAGLTQANVVKNEMVRFDAAHPDLYFDAVENVVNRTFLNSPAAKLITSVPAGEQLKVLPKYLDWVLARADEAAAREYDMFVGPNAASLGISPRQAATQQFHREATHINNLIPNGAAREAVHEGREVTAKELRETITPHPERGYAPVSSDVAHQMTGYHQQVKNLAAVGRKAVNWMFKWIGTMPEDTFARMPYAAERYRMHMDDLIERAVTVGGEKPETVNMLALERKATAAAVADVRKTLYTLDRKHRALESIRLLSAFAEAQYNSLGFWGRMIAQNPQYAGRIGLIANAVTKSNLVDEDGNLAFPLPDFLTKHLPGGPTEFNSNIRSIANIYANTENKTNPFIGMLLPGPAPWVTLAGSELSKTRDSGSVLDWFSKNVPGGGTLVNQLLGPAGVSAEEGSWDRMLPPSLTKIWHFIDSNDPNDPYVSGLKVTAMEQRYTRWVLGGKKGPAPKVDDEETLSMVRGQILLSFFTGMVSPVGGQWKDTNHKHLSNIYQMYKENYGKDADRIMLQQFPEAIGLLASSRGRSGIPATWDAVRYMDDHKDFLSQLGKIDPNAPALLVPYVKGFDQSAYRYQQANTVPGSDQAIRPPLSPEEAQRQFEASVGFQKYRLFKDKIDVERQQNGWKIGDPGYKASKMRLDNYVDELKRDYRGFGIRWDGPPPTSQGLDILHTIAYADDKFAKENAMLVSGAQEIMAARDKARNALDALPKFDPGYAGQHAIQDVYEGAVDSATRKDERLGRIMSNYMFRDSGTNFETPNPTWSVR